MPASLLRAILPHDCAWALACLSYSASVSGGVGGGCGGKERSWVSITSILVVELVVWEGKVGLLIHEAALELREEIRRFPEVKHCSWSVQAQHKSEEDRSSTFEAPATAASAISAAYQNPAQSSRSLTQVSKLPFLGL